MAIIRKNVKSTKQDSKAKGGKTYTYYDSEGNVTTNPSDISNIEKRIKNKTLVTGYKTGTAETSETTPSETETQNQIIKPGEILTTEEFNQRKQDYAIQQAAATEAAQQEELTNVEIPRAEDLASETVGVLSEAIDESKQNIVGGETLGGWLDKTTLGQAMTGYDLIQQLKSAPEEVQQEVLNQTSYMIEYGLTPEQMTDDLAMQSVLRLKLTENDLKVLKDAKNDVGKLAILIEGLPVFSQFTKITGGALTPTSAYAKYNDLNEQVTSINTKIENLNEAITRNPQLIGEYEALIDEYEQDLYDLQSRIKFLIIQSPVLQNNPEEVENDVQEIDKGLVMTGKIRSTIIITKYGG